MTDDLNPTGPAQPTVNQAYQTSGNAASKEPLEQDISQLNAQDKSEKTDQRIPQKQTTSSDEATASSLGRGVRGAGPGEEAYGKTERDVGRNQELEAEQMAAPGEGKVAEAVESKSGAGGGQPGLEGDMERKKAEHFDAKGGAGGSQQEGVDVAGVLGQR